MGVDGLEAFTDSEVVPIHRTNSRPIYVGVGGLETFSGIFVLVPVWTRPMRSPPFPVFIARLPRLDARTGPGTPLPDTRSPALGAA